jgi:hypothetical protein
MSLDQEGGSELAARNEDYFPVFRHALYATNFSFFARLGDILMKQRNVIMVAIAGEKACNQNNGTEEKKELSQET